jgi:hypothetical protein
MTTNLCGFQPSFVVIAQLVRMRFALAQIVPVRIEGTAPT